jgi:hypothetical protein
MLTGGGTGYYTLAVGCNALGDRVNAISQYFQRFKFNSLRFQFRAKMNVTTNGTGIFGIGDDPDGTSITVGSTPHILDYRTSREEHLYNDVTLRWSPLDKDKWYYTADLGDDRFAKPCWVAVGSEDVTTSTGAVYYAFDLHYSITLAGACDIGLATPNQDDAYVSLPPTPSGGPASKVPAPKSSFPPPRK